MGEIICDVIIIIWWLILNQDKLYQNVLIIKGTVVFWRLWNTEEGIPKPYEPYEDAASANIWKRKIAGLNMALAHVVGWGI